MFGKKIRIQNGKGTDVFVVNNAGLFGLYTALKLGQLEHNNIILAYPGYWLDNSHSVYGKNLWGQNPLTLPPAVQKIFFELYSTHEPTYRMTWLQYKTLRHSIIHQIVSYKNVLFFRGQLSVEQTAPTLEITVNGVSNMSLSIEGHTRLHYWLHEPRKNTLGLGEPTPSFKLYHLAPKHYPDPLCILGAGLTTAWAARDFNTTIVSLHLPNDPQIIISANAEVDMSRLHRLLLDTNKMHFIKNNTIYYYPTSNPNLPTNLTCPLYDAIGLLPVHPPKSILPENIGWSWNATDKCEWVAPKDTPVGSMLHSYSLLAHKTNNYFRWFGQYPGQYCENSFYPDFLKQIQAHGIDLTTQFFSVLKSQIQSLESSVNKDTILGLYAKSYNATGQNQVHFTRFMDFILQNAETPIRNHRANINTIPTVAEISTCKQNYMLEAICQSEERYILQYVRAYFETHLAFSLGHDASVLQTTRKIAMIVHDLMQLHKKSIIGMIKQNPMFQLTIYSDEKFARLHEPLEHCLPADVLFQQFQNVLLDSHDSFALIHLICMFSFRILPFLDTDARKDQFDALLNRFESNSTFRNNATRLSKSYIKHDTLIKTFFGLVPNDLPQISSHLPSMGKFYTEDAVYLSNMNRFGHSFVTGYSGHSSRLLSLAFSHLVLTREEQQMFTAATFAYLAGGGNHNFHEVYSVARSFGLPFTDGSYREALPKQYIASDAYIEVQNHLKIKLHELAKSYPAYSDFIYQAGAVYFGLASSANLTSSWSISSDQFAVPPYYLRSMLEPKNHPVYEHGAWDNITIVHQPSGLSIFSYRAYNASIEVGKVILFARPSLCFSNDGQFNNTIEMTGVFSKPSYQHAIVDSCEQDIKLYKTDTLESQGLSEITQDYPSTTDVLSSAVINGALLAAIPEAIGDLFWFYGHVSEKRAEEIKWVATTSIILLTGGWIGAAASWVTTHTLKSAGISEPKARIAGNAMSFFINTGQNLTTPLGIAATTLQIASGSFGLWAEKQVVKTIVGQEAYDAKVSQQR